MEIWKEVKGYKDYKVSNLGRVKSLKAGKERIMNPAVDYNGYFNLSLYKNGKGKTRVIHQLVAESFLNHEPCGYDLVIDHINEVKTDNNVNNLRLVSARENCSKRKGSSKYVGVCWYKQTNKWKAQIKANGKIKSLGYFTHELEASKAYQSALSALK